MKEIIIDMPTPELAKAFKNELETRFGCPVVANEELLPFEPSDVYDIGVLSDCCGAGVYLNGICAECNDHCTPVYEEEDETNNEI